MNIFVTSTGEKTGKTIFGAGVAAVMQSLGYEMAVYKPVQTGCKYASDKQFSPDLNFVKKLDPNIKTYSSYNLKLNQVPAVAMENEHVKFTLESIIRDYSAAKQENDIMIVEGCGGIMTPITGRISNIEIAQHLKLPVVIVIDVKNDFVNKAMLTINAAEDAKLEVLGVVFNNYSPTDKKNKFHQEVKLVEQMIEHGVLGYIPNVNVTGEGIYPESLISEILQNIDLSRVFDMEIPKLSF
ncbi:MAG: dethiobiotin synthase [bacterium]|nr:dethiobiotin synthase [bacterium]